MYLFAESLTPSNSESIAVLLIFMNLVLVLPVIISFFTAWNNRPLDGLGKVLVGSLSVLFVIMAVFGILSGFARRFTDGNLIDGSDALSWALAILSGLSATVALLSCLGIIARLIKNHFGKSR